MMRDKLMELLSEHYGRYMDETFCGYMCDEILRLMDGTRYSESLKQWMHGIIDINEKIVIKINGKEAWSLLKVAESLDEDFPNIPAAAVLLNLAEEYPLTMSTILSVAAKECDADYRMTIDENIPCTAAILDTETRLWTFFAEDSKPEYFRPFQMWQVLLNQDTLAPLISYDHELGTRIELWNDGRYHIIPPQDE